MPDTSQLILEMVKSVDGRLNDLTNKVDDLPSRHEFEDLKKAVSNHGRLPNWLVAILTIISLSFAGVAAFTHATAPAQAATPSAIIHQVGH